MAINNYLVILIACLTYQIHISNSAVVKVSNERVAASPSTVTVAEGNDLYLRLETPTEQHETCKLYDPTGAEATLYELDPTNTNACGFIVPNIKQSDSGEWTIVYGADIVYKALTQVKVTPRWENNASVLTWHLDQPVNQIVGPENAVYCRARSPTGFVAFEDFGSCNIAIERATQEHIGVWTLTVGMPGRVITEDLQFLVTVTAADPKPVVSVHVEKQQPEVILSCSVAVEEDVKGCKFRDPSGRLLLATEGVGEDRYVFYGQDVTVRSGVQNRQCGLRITNPQTSDLGLWRCALETDSDTYYGFLSVICPWSMQDPNVAAAVVTEPVLTADRNSVTAMELDSVTMSCSVQSAIRYCYFRNRMGRTISVAPGNVGRAIEYVGAGFDAGDCGIRFNVAASDSGSWSCHVGFVNQTEPEQRAAISLQVDEYMVAKQEVQGDVLHIEGRVFWNRPLDYCRFVRIDGVGFTSENLPAGYRSDSVLANGVCSLRITNPSIIEHHPWGVVARVTGHDYEITRDTSHTIPEGTPGHENDGQTPRPDEDGDLGGPDNTPGQIIVIEKTSTFTTVWLSVLTVLFAVVLIGALVYPKRNRDWTRARISGARDSLRRSLTKPPLPADFPREHTANAA